MANKTIDGQGRTCISGWFPPDLVERLRAEAKATERSLNGQMAFIFRRYFEAQDKKKK